MTAFRRAGLIAAPAAAATPLRQGFARILALGAEGRRAIRERASAPLHLDGGLWVAVSLQPAE